MPIFRIVVQDSHTKISEKEFEADTLEEAQELAEEEKWSEDSGWTVIDEYTNCEIREDMCRDE